MLVTQRSRGGIIDILPKNSIGAEIGVKAGRFSRVLAAGTTPQHLYLIDPWWKLPQVVPGTKTHAAMMSFLGKTQERMRWWIKRQRVTIVVDRSQDALPTFADDYFDWVYLDSSHGYRETQEELLLCRAKVKAHGIICGHDFNTRRHPGVFKAISEFLDANKAFRLCYLDNFQQWAIDSRKK